jgi:hypothetical protein
MAAERKMQPKVEEIKREQNIAKITGEKATEENQIMGKIGTIRTQFASERIRHKIVWW